MSIRRIALLLLFVVAGGAVLYPKARALISPQTADAQQAASGPSQPASAAASGKARAGGSGGAPTIAVYTAVAVKKTVPITQTYVGSVEPIDQVSIRPRVDGVIVEKAVDEGQAVKAGDLLFRLDDLSIQASIAKDQAAISRDQANLDQANADLQRAQTLQGHGDNTTQQVEQQQVAVKVAAATLASDKAQLQADDVQLGYTKITAPIGGRVGAVSVTEGALVRASDTAALLTITEMAPVRVSFDVPEGSLGAFRAALASATAPVVKALEPTSGKVVSNGVLTFVDSSIDTLSGTVTLKAQFDNADTALWPGAYVRVEAQLGAYTDATTVPTSAVQLNGDESFVFLVQPGATVTRRVVSVAHTAGDTAVIASGLKPGDHVVVEGQLRLVEGSRIKETLGTATGGPAAGASG